MVRQTQQSPEALAELFGLLVECPLHGGNPDHCLFRSLRSMDLAERYRWTKEIGVDEAAVMRSRCAECMAAGLVQGGAQYCPSRRPGDVPPNAGCARKAV